MKREEGRRNIDIDVCVCVSICVCYGVMCSCIHLLLSGLSFIVVLMLVYIPESARQCLLGYHAICI